MNRLLGPAKSLRRLGFALALTTGLLLVLGCASMSTPDPITLSAETAAIVGEQAVRTNTQYVQFCSAGAITPDKCFKWSEWFRGFQKQYAAAHAAYKVATANGDIKSAKDAADRIQLLSDQLVLYAIYNGGR